MDAATLNDLRAMAEAGRMDVPIQLHLSVDDPTPEAGSEVMLHWRGDGDDLAGLHLLLPDGQRLAVPAEGRRRLAVGGEPLVVALVAGASRVEARIQPQVAVPLIRLEQAGPWVMEQYCTLRWTTYEAVSVRLHLMQGGQVVEDMVAPQGERSFVPDRLMPIRVEMEALSRHAYISERARARHVMEVEIVPIVPVIQRWHVPRAVLGEPVRLEWAVADAERVSIEGEGIHHEGEAFDSCEFTPDRLGTLDLTMEARSRHAGLSPLATIQARQRLHVVAPPIEIELLSAPEQWLPPGSEAGFHWVMRGVAHATLEALSRGECYALPLIGSLFVTVEVMDEAFHLRATGHDGQVRQITFIIHAAIPDISEPIDEIDLLFYPLNEINLLRS